MVVLSHFGQVDDCYSWLLWYRSTHVDPHYDPVIPVKACNALFAVERTALFVVAVAVIASE